jgi:hypothetical protein
MPALAMRFTGGAAGRLRRDANAAATGIRFASPVRAAEGPSQPLNEPLEDDRRAEDPVCVRLAAEFAAVPYRTVRRCVADAGARAAHLGVDVASPEVVERLARERLLALVNSIPPSGAVAFRW